MIINTDSTDVDILSHRNNPRVLSIGQLKSKLLKMKSNTDLCTRLQRLRLLVERFCDFEFFWELKLFWRLNKKSKN